MPLQAYIFESESWYLRALFSDIPLASTMVKRGSIWRMSALWAAIGALSISTRCFAQEHDQLKNVLSEALLASPPGSTRNSATEDLFDGPLANCTLRGPIENAQCNYEQVDAINEDFHTQLQSIVTTPYFRYYKTDLDKSCPFWPDDALCTNRNCAVQTLDDVCCLQSIGHGWMETEPACVCVCVCVCFFSVMYQKNIG